MVPKQVCVGNYTCVHAKCAQSLFVFSSSLGRIMHRHAHPHLAVFAPSSCFPFTSCFIIWNYFPSVFLPRVSPPCSPSAFLLRVFLPCIPYSLTFFASSWLLSSVSYQIYIPTCHDFTYQKRAPTCQTHPPNSHSHLSKLTVPPVKLAISPVKTHASSSVDFASSTSGPPVRPVHLSNSRPHLSNSRPLSVKLASLHLSNSSGPP